MNSEIVLSDHTVVIKGGLINKIGNSEDIEVPTDAFIVAEIYAKMIRALHAAGAGILLGTDTGNTFVFAGFAVHEELQYLVNLGGFTPYEAIRTTTINAAESLDKLDVFGTIRAGKRADMILVDENPLDDIENIKKIAGVVLRGTWIQKSHIQVILENA
ncbi:MAG: amidohydrolase family protein [Candidatus Hodarchaeales archaeon]|jgi:imidazolonepropionase-like amidohydrolase